MDKKILDIMLWLGKEESDLFEVIWELNTKFPELSYKEKFRIAHESIKELLDSNLIELFLFNRLSGNYSKVSDNNEVRKILLEKESWEPQDIDKIAFRIVITDEGEKLLS